MTLFNRLKRLEDTAGSMVKPPLTEQDRQELHDYPRQFVESCGPRPELSEDEKRDNLTDFKRELYAKAYPSR